MFNLNEKEHTVEKLNYAYSCGYKQDGIVYIKCKETSLFFTTSYFMNSEPGQEESSIPYKYCPYCGKRLNNEH